MLDGSRNLYLKKDPPPGLEVSSTALVVLPTSGGFDLGTVHPGHEGMRGPAVSPRVISVSRIADPELLKPSSKVPLDLAVRNTE